ncbi:MAG: hypothetical protein H6658_19630 [Ardenticatenaceae bacterium]|nr:hypothetical protein [Ardenticatenaceae bacterium]
MQTFFSCRSKRLVWLWLWMALLVACGSPEAEPVPTQVVVEIAATAVSPTPMPPTDEPTTVPTATMTETAVPTETGTATAVPTITPTFIPTNTPQPPATATTAATATAAATAVPTSPPPPPVTATPAFTTAAIGSLPESMGQEVTVNGTVVHTASFSGGFKFTLSDGTGQVTLLMWHNVYDECWAAPELNRGAMVQATGEVGMFEGELQIVPDFGGDVKVTAVGAPFAPERSIGDLGNHMGELVQITGQINRIESISSGAKIFVMDDTGEILVFVWSNILDRVPNNVALGVPGTTVRVVGAVEEFRSNREIVPALPYDIVVLP